MPFKFSLETLLNHRRRQEDLVAPQLAEAQQAVATEEIILNRLHALAQWGEQELARNQAKGKAGWELAIFHDFLVRVRAETRRSEERLAEAGTHLETVRNDLLEKRKRRRVVEVLKDRIFQEYRLHTERAEQRNQDEIAATQFNRSRDAR